MSRLNITVRAPLQDLDVLTEMVVGGLRQEGIATTDWENEIKPGQTVQEHEVGLLKSSVIDQF